MKPIRAEFDFVHDQTKGIRSVGVHYQDGHMDGEIVAIGFDPNQELFGISYGRKGHPPTIAYIPKSAFDQIVTFLYAEIPTK